MIFMLQIARHFLIHISRLLLVVVLLLAVVSVLADEDELLEDKNTDMQALGGMSQKDWEYLRKQRLAKNLQRLELLKKKGVRMSENTLVKLVSHILNDDSGNVSALNTLGSFYLERGKPGLAKILYARAMETHPKNSSLHSNKGVVALKLEDEKTAISHFRDSLQYRYSNYVAAANLGALYMNAYEYDLSLDYMKLAYSRAKSYLPKNHPDVLKIGNNYAVALAWNKNFRKAQSIFSEIVYSHIPVEVALNYAILLGKDLQDKSSAFRMLSKADLLNKSGRYASKIKAVRSYLVKRDKTSYKKGSGKDNAFGGRR